MSEKNFLGALRTLCEIEVARAPARHSLQTQKCLTLARFMPWSQANWTDSEREHVSGCRYCQRMMALVWREECPRLWTLVKYKYAMGTFPFDEAMRFHVDRDGCPRCSRILNSPLIDRLKNLVAQGADLAGSAVAAYGEVASAAEFASIKRPALHIRDTSEDGLLVSTLLETAEGLLVLHVESPDRKNIGRRVVAEVISESGSLLRVELELVSAGEFGCRAEHAYGRIRDLPWSRENFVFLVRWLGEAG